MRNFPYVVRNYQLTDFDKYVQLNTEAEKLDPVGRGISARIIAEHLSRPNYSPERDLFIIEIAGGIVGYMDMAVEVAIGRVILDCWVQPKYRRNGLATELLGSAVHRAQEYGVKVAHINIAQDNTVAKNVLSRLGFECVRKFLELRLDMAEVNWQDVGQATLECRSFRRGEEDKLTQIQNRSFAGSWGYNPNTEETITYSMNRSNHSSEDVILACDGDKVVGYCWTEIIDERRAAVDERKGRIHMIGADPNYRGKGVGKRALLAGLDYIQSKGLQITELTVDNENKVACALYYAIGFEVWTSSLWYEKSLN